MTYFKPYDVKKIQKIGNSLMLSISPYQAERMGLQVGSEVWVRLDEKDKRISITKRDGQNV